MGNIILIAIIAILMVIGFFRAKKDQMREMEEKEQEEINKRTMPDGNMVPEDDVLLAMTDEEFDAYNRPNLMFVINYVAYKEIDAPEEPPEEAEEAAADIPQAPID